MRLILAVALALAAACAHAQVSFGTPKNPRFTGQTLAPDGSASVPAYSFANDTNTGFYSSGVDQIGGAINGAHIFRFTASDFRIEHNSGALYFGQGGDIALVRETGFPAFRIFISANAPTIGACGTTPSLVGNNNAMLLTVGTGGIATSCAATFGGTWTNAPVCACTSSNTADGSLAVTTTTTSVTCAKATALTASSNIHVLCFGR